MRAIITPMLVFPATTAFTLKANNLPCKKECRPKTYIQAVDIDLQQAIPLLAAASIGAWWFSGSESRAKQAQYAEWENQQTEYQAERERLAHIEPKDAWTVNELAHYNGEDENGPILMAVKGDVYNVWKGRNFYGVGGEYHIMAGRDATRFLAKNRLDEETEEQLKVELNIAERANLEVRFIHHFSYPKVGFGLFPNESVTPFGKS